MESILNVTCYAKILVTKSVTEIARSPKRRKSLLCDTWDVIKGLGHHEYQKLGSRLRFKPRQDQFYAVNFYCHSSSVAVPCCVHLQAANDDWLNLSNLTFFCNQQSSPGYRKAYLDASCSFDLPFNFLECFPCRHRVRSGGCHDDFLFQCWNKEGKFEENGGSTLSEGTAGGIEKNSITFGICQNYLAISF